MKYKEYYAAAEAVLFASGEPVSAERLGAALELDVPTLTKMMNNLMDIYHEEDRGIQIVRLDDSYQMCTKPAFAGQIKQVLELKRTAPLSSAALEVLAIIAYNEPVTKGFIEQVRGVDSSSIVNNLHEKALIEEAGRLEVPGRPIAYRTSPNFLRCFGMSSLHDLPPLPDESGQVKMEEVVQGADN